MHRGQEYEHDLDVERLQQVTRRIIIGFAEHPTPEHRPDRRSCVTFGQAMACSAALARDRRTADPHGSAATAIIRS